MPIEINDNVVFVQGAVNGAIYNLNTGDVFSVNGNSCDVINKYIHKEDLFGGEQNYIFLLKENKLLDDSFTAGPYTTSPKGSSLNMCWLEITQQCNCRCIHCYEGETHIKSSNTLNINEWKKIIDQIAELNVKRVVVIGGEPCVSENVYEILDYLTNYKIDTTLFTNGTHISEKLGKLIIDKGIRLKFSLYGHNENVHDSITNHLGSFVKLINNIKYYKDHNVDISVSVVIMKENEKYYDDIKKFLEANELKYKFDVIREVFGGMQSDHIPENQELIKSVMRTSPKFGKVYKDKFDFALNHNTCWCGKIVICEEGTVLPCVFERNIKYGNILKNSLLEILDSSDLRECWDHTFDNVNECKNCEFRFACKDCRPLAIANGNIQTKNPRCTYDVNNGEWNG